jgi:predicted O-linked N-acetylglucosamine transferase (SPINDLY family)
VKLQIAGQLSAAEEIYRSILKDHPVHAAASHCLGLLLVHRQQPAEGAPHLLAALNGNPEIPDYWLGYLESLLLLGRSDEAKTTLALGRQHGLSGKAVEEFAARLESRLSAQAAPTPTAAPDPEPVIATPLRPSPRKEAKLAGRDEDSLLAMIKQGRFIEALALARSVTERRPERGLGWKVLGALLWAEKDKEAALTAMRTAVRLLPNDAEALRNLGTALGEMSLLAEAEIVLRRALAIDPKSISLRNDLGGNQWLQGRPEEAEAHFRGALALTAGRTPTPTTDALYTGLLFAMSHNLGVDAETLFAEHCRFGEYLEGRRGPRPRHLNDPDPERRLRVGFVSGDLWNHSIASFIEPIWARLQTSPRVQLHAYYNHDLEDAVSRRLRTYVNDWRAVVRLSDRDLAQQIKDDRIDILIDLSGHTSLNRLRMFSRKPAPIQASWMGYPGTTGLRAMDYYLADRHFLPPGRFDRQFTEKLVYMPAGAPFQPHPSAPPVNALPALGSGRMTFGSFNRLSKINSETLNLWSQLLRAVPTANMLIAGMPPEYPQAQMITEFEAAGIARERLTFHSRCNMLTYLAQHHQVDICLDTYPYSGGTTTYHALWMGVPTLTIGGATPVSRQGAAIFGHLDLECFVAADASDFVAKGAYWANQPAALAEVRAGLRERALKSAVCDPHVIAASFIRATRHMWSRWCDGLPAESFEIAASSD